MSLQHWLIIIERRMKMSLTELGLSKEITNVTVYILEKKEPLLVDYEVYSAFDSLRKLRFKWFTASQRANILFAFKEKPSRDEHGRFFTQDPHDMIVVDHICIDFITDDWKHRTYYSIDEYYEKMKLKK